MRNPDRFFIPDSVATLRPFIEAGLFDQSCVYFVDAVCRRSGEQHPLVKLGAALTVRGPQFGHVCVPITDIERSVTGEGLTSDLLAQLPWPDINAWKSALSSSVAVHDVDSESTGDVRPLVFDGENLYLARYWTYEQQVAKAIVDRSSHATETANTGTQLSAAIDSLPAELREGLSQEQLEALHNALTRQFSVIAGGPGTGKTHTISLLLRLLAVDVEREQPLRVGLCAPTGKAAARMADAIAQTFSALEPSPELAVFAQRMQSSTIQRMLGATFDGRYRFSENDLLPFDIVIVDEGSMISLPLMRNLLNALRPETNVVIVGDPFQLASIEAGAVLGDIVAATVALPHEKDTSGGLGRCVATLTSTHRFAGYSDIARCAQLTRDGDSNGLLDYLHDNGAGDVRYIQHDDRQAVDQILRESVEQAQRVMDIAQGDDAEHALSQLSADKLLCATRYGDYGSLRWTANIEHGLSIGRSPVLQRQRWFTGKPLIATKNDYANNIFNGDVGVIVNHEGRQQVAMSTGTDIRWFSLSPWIEADPWWVMTIHRSQGSEFDHVVVLLPEEPMPLLTRELLYTAMTRAKSRLTIVGNDNVVRTAVDRRIGRSTGLTALLQG